MPGLQIASTDNVVTEGNSQKFKNASVQLKGLPSCTPNLSNILSVKMVYTTWQNIFEKFSSEESKVS